MSEIKVYDKNMVLRDWDWLVENFGPIVIHSANSGIGWRIRELHESDDAFTESWRGVNAPCAIIVSLEQDGEPAIGQQVAWYWPDAPVDEDCGPVNGVPDEMIPNRCDFPGSTNDNGDVGFAMGPGGGYAPPNIGPHAVWIYGEQTNSDVIWGLGWLWDTNHRHLDVIYELTDENGNGCDCEAIKVLAEEIKARNGKIGWQQKKQREAINALLELLL